MKKSHHEQDNAYTLVLVRHGQSEWNRLNLFTGWRDPDLTERGVIEARWAGRVLRDYGLKFDQGLSYDDKNMPYRRIWTKPIDSYAKGYNEFDIALAPTAPIAKFFNLVTNEFSGSLAVSTAGYS